MLTQFSATKHLLGVPANPDVNGDELRVEAPLDKFSKAPRMFLKFRPRFLCSFPPKLSELSLQFLASTSKNCLENFARFLPRFLFSKI